MSSTTSNERDDEASMIFRNFWISPNYSYNPDYRALYSHHSE
jgi:hypothetical protein